MYELTKNGYELTKVRVDLGTSWPVPLNLTKMEIIRIYCSLPSVHI